MDLTKRVSDREILKRFKRGNFVNNEEEARVLERYASTGMVTFGFNYKEKKADARLTEQGKWLLSQMY